MSWTDCLHLVGTSVVVSAVVVGCQPPPEEGPGPGTVAGETTAEGVDTGSDAEEEIEAFLERALPLLAEAYRSGEVEQLRPVATERVLAQVEKRILDLMEQGMRVEPTFESVTVEEVSSWRNDNAIVTTVETWDLRYISTGEGALISEQPDARSRVTYHLRKERGEGWRIYQRDLRQQFDGER